MLRARLTLGLLCLMLILLAIGLFSINRCSEFGRSVLSLSRTNRQTTYDLEMMRRGVSGITGALLLEVTGNRDEAQKSLAASNQIFSRALADQQARTERTAKESRVLAQINAFYPAYAREADIFLQAPTNRPEPKMQSIAAGLGRRTAQLLELVSQLQAARLQSIEDGDKTEAANINNTVRSLILLMIAAVAVFIYASLRLSHGLLFPLKTLATSIDAVGQGNLNQNVPIFSTDELGVLATAFNRMAQQLRDYRDATSVELTRLNLTVRATLASFPNPIFVLNAEGAIELRNPAADHLAVKLLFTGVRRLPDQLDQRVEGVRSSGEDYLPMLFSEAIKFHLDGQERYYLPRVVLLRDEKRETFGVAVILEDVTRMLLLDDVKSNLISTVSHELKTPLTSVRMALYLLYENTVGPLNPKQVDLVATAREDADRLLHTLNDLLDLAKLEHGSSGLELRLVRPQEVVEDVVRATREIANEAQIKVVTEVEPDLPSVLIDRQRLAYVVTNLLTNAIKYSPAAGTVLVRAQASFTRAGQSGVRFCFKDRGRGIAPEHQEHIFERFYRIPGTLQVGAGLGLSIAREVVAAHAGEIGVISQLDEGSEFFFVLPKPDSEPARRPHP